MNGTCKNNDQTKTLTLTQTKYKPPKPENAEVIAVSKEQLPKDDGHDVFLIVMMWVLGGLFMYI